MSNILLFKMVSMGWKYPLKITLAGDDNHQFFKETNNPIMTT